MSSMNNHRDHDPPKTGKAGQGITIKKSNEHRYSLQRSGRLVKHYDKNGGYIEQFNVFNWPLLIAQNDIAYQDDNNTFWFCSEAADKVFNVNSSLDSIISQFTKDAFDSNAVKMEGIAFDASNNTLWICDFDTDKIYNVSLTGTLINSFSSPNTQVSGISVGNNDDLWLVHGGSPDIVYNITKGGVAISQFNTTTFEPLNINPCCIYVLDKF